MFLDFRKFAKTAKRISLFQDPHIFNIYLYLFYGAFSAYTDRDTYINIVCVCIYIYVYIYIYNIYIFAPFENKLKPEDIVLPFIC